MISTSRRKRYEELLDELISSSSRHYARPTARNYADILDGSISQGKINRDLYLLYLTSQLPILIEKANYRELSRIRKYLDRSYGHARLFISGPDTDNLLLDISSLISYGSSLYFGVNWNIHYVDSISGLKNYGNQEILVINDKDDDYSIYKRYVRNESSFNSLVDIIITNDFLDYRSDRDITERMVDFGSMMLETQTGTARVSAYGQNNVDGFNRSFSPDIDDNAFYPTNDYLLGQRLFKMIRPLDYEEAMVIAVRPITKRLLSRISSDLKDDDLLDIAPYKFTPDYVLIKGFLKPIANIVRIEEFSEERYHVHYNNDKDWLIFTNSSGNPRYASLGSDGNSLVPIDDDLRLRTSSKGLVSLNSDYLW